MSRRGDIINAMRTDLATNVSTLSTSRILRQPIDISVVRSQPVLFLHVLEDIRDKETGTGKKDRLMALLVALLTSADPSKKDTESCFEQVDDIWEVVHARLETLADDATFTQTCTLEEDDDGVQFIPIEKPAMAVALSLWQVRYSRSVGSV